jgi:hypothetical protein
MITKDNGAALSRSNQSTQASGCQYKCLVESSHLLLSCAGTISNLQYPSDKDISIYLWHYPPRLGNFKMSSIFFSKFFLINVR